MPRRLFISSLPLSPVFDSVSTDQLTWPAPATAQPQASALTSMAHGPFIRLRAKPLPHSAPVPQVVVLEISASFEERSSSSDNSSRPYSLLGHRRTGSEPAAPRLPSPYTQTSQSNPTFVTTTYGYEGSTVPDRSETQSPTSSMRTIRSR
jgi:hypothetical protein